MKSASGLFVNVYAVLQSEVKGSKEVWPFRPLKDSSDSDVVAKRVGVS